jgi:malonyl-CoA O-methyltransferase
MTANIDRNRVRSSFCKQAEQYDSNVVVQKRVVERFVRLLAETGVPYGRFLDVGAGTGMLLRKIEELYPGMPLIGADLAFGMCQTAAGSMKQSATGCFMVADAEHLPLRDACCATVASTSTFQWLPTLDPAFSECRRVLADDGLFIFALFGRRTLFELRDSWRWALTRAGREHDDRTHRFLAVDEVKQSLVGAGFTDCRVFSEMETEHYGDVPELLRALRKIGAGNASPQGGRSLAERRVMLEMMERYREEFGCDGMIPATYEVVYGVGRKALN